jgi:probable phosphoglycerate mutase
MVQIVLIRPGTSEFDEQGRIQGTLDIPLTEQGQREVHQSIADLKPLGLGILYCSPCESAWQSASALAEGLGIKARRLDAMENLDCGLWQGMQLEEVKRKQPKVFRQWQEHPELVCPPEGETYGDCRDRVDVALSKLAKKHRSGTIGIVAPEPLAGIIYRALATEEVGDGWDSSERGTAWAVLRDGPASGSSRGLRKPAECTQPTSESDPKNGWEDHPLLPVGGLPLENQADAGSNLHSLALESQADR